MQEEEKVEKVRQAIMRYRELLDVLQARIANAEKEYVDLFRDLSEEQRALPEKLQQREAARTALNDMEALRHSLLRVKYDTRDIEHAFEEIYNNIAPGEGLE